MVGTILYSIKFNIIGWTGVMLIFPKGIKMSRIRILYLPNICALLLTFCNETKLVFIATKLSILYTLERQNTYFKLINNHLYCTLQRLSCLVQDGSNNNDDDDR